MTSAKGLDERQRQRISRNWKIMMVLIVAALIYCCVCVGLEYKKESDDQEERQRMLEEQDHSITLGVSYYCEEVIDPQSIRVYYDGEDITKYAQISMDGDHRCSVSVTSEGRWTDISKLKVTA